MPARRGRRRQRARRRKRMLASRIRPRWRLKNSPECSAGCRLAYSKLQRPHPRTPEICAVRNNRAERAGPIEIEKKALLPRAPQCKPENVGASASVDRPPAWASGGEKQEDEAIEDRRLAEIDRREEAHREMGHEIGGGHEPRQNERHRTREQADRNQ